MTSPPQKRKLPNSGKGQSHKTQKKDSKHDIEKPVQKPIKYKETAQTIIEKTLNQAEIRQWNLESDVQNQESKNEVKPLQEKEAKTEDFIERIESQLRDDDIQNNINKRDIGEDSTRSSKRQHENRNQSKK